MTNLLEKWHIYTKHLESPQSYIDFGFYWLISSCLQRRVWYFEDEGALYTNLYITLVGPPATGKGLVLSRVKELLSYHKNEKKAKVITNAGQEFPPLFPVGSDATTFEALLQDMESKIVITPVDKSIISTGIYSHTSYAFCLTELSSLFKRNREDLSKFLIKAYDCEDYDNSTKHMGINRIRKMCLNFAAATQLEFIKEGYRNNLFGQGFVSRVLWIFENRTRFDKFHIGKKDAEMEAARKEILDWIKRLAGVLGQLTYNEEVSEWLEHWYATELVPKRDTASVKMQEYYGRKRVNLLKLAASVHFSHSLSYEITLPDFHKALDLLNSIETNMAFGFSASGRNELYQYTLKILQRLRKGAARKSILMLEFGMDITLDEFEMILKELEFAYGMKTKMEKGEVICYL